MNWNPFKKKQEEESLDPLSDLSLSRLKPGYVLDYDLKTWQVTAHNRYDYDGDWADEWELTCAAGVLYLEREVDDEETWAVYRKIDLDEIQEDVRAAIMEDDDPPNHVDRRRGHLRSRVERRGLLSSWRREGDRRFG